MTNKGSPAQLISARQGNPSTILLGRPTDERQHTVDSLGSSLLTPVFA
jgi:hypothetical protein